MRPSTCAALLLFASVGQLTAQERISWTVLGDTGRAPAGCSAKAAIAAIDAWFSAFNEADSAGLAATTAWRTGFVFSTGKHWTVADKHRRIDAFPGLIGYVRERRAKNERLTLEKVVFYGWLRGDDLGFMPYYTRAADDLGPVPLSGLGKATYQCRQGIHVLNLAPVKQVIDD
jgi:hypothetical protein